MDYYIENPEKLEGQPKRAIGDYVANNGILVPRRFDSLEEARRSHRAVLLRSEHSQDYDGVSGLLDSFRLSRRMFDVSDPYKGGNKEFSPRGIDSIEDIKGLYFRFKESCDEPPNYKEYCKFLGIDEDKFKQDVSFSIWEAMGGINRTVVADSAIPDRYHVRSYINEGNRFYFNHTIVERGRLIQEFIMKLPSEFMELGKLIETYEAVRNLERFDPNHCPIMEFQTHNGKDYFLQYHRARDFSQSEFALERELKDGESEVMFVRGTTPEEGMDCKVTVCYAIEKELDSDPKIEDGSYDFNCDEIISELRVRNRKVQMINSKRLETEFLKFVGIHMRNSRLFKPQVSIIHDIKDVLHGESLSDYSKMSLSGKNSYLDLHIVSDGRRAFVQRI